VAQILSYDTDGVTTEHWPTVREGKVAGITTKTDQGTVATSPVNIPDPDGTHVIRGLRRAYISESDCPVDFNVIYDGYLGPRTYGRDAEHFTGSRRVIGATLVDHNTLLTNYLIQGAKDAAHGDRPEETDLERIAWLLASAFTHPIQDFGAIATTGGVLMDAADVRGQNAGSVFRDCGLISGRQHFLYYYEAEPTEQRIGLFYNKSSAPVWSSTLRLSNHPGDADDIRDPDAITFELDSEQPPVMTRKPDWIASDVLIDYDGGQLFVACEDVGLTTRDDYYVKQLVVPAPNVKTAAGALRLATQQLQDHSTEQDIANVRVLLPSSHIGLIQPGHRLECRFDHFEPEYRDFMWWRIQEHAWAQRGRKWYWLDLTLEPLEPLPCEDEELTPSGYYPPLYGIPPYPAGPYYSMHPNTHYINGGASLPGTVTNDHSGDNWGFPVFHTISASPQAPDGAIDTAWAGAGNKIAHYVVGYGTLTAHVPKGLEWGSTGGGALYQASLLVWTGVTFEAVEVRDDLVPDTDAVFEITDDGYCLHVVRIDMGYDLGPDSAYQAVGNGGFTWAGNDA
jgi:hypothetical protein